MWIGVSVGVVPTLATVVGLGDCSRGGRLEVRVRWYARAEVKFRAGWMADLTAVAPIDGAVRSAEGSHMHRSYSAVEFQ